MSKRWVSLLLAAALLACAGGALAEAYSFPYAGVRLQAGEDWTVLAPATLAGQKGLLAQLGTDMEALLSDYAASHTVFEVYLPEGMQVALTAVQTQQSAAWDEVAAMNEADKARFEEALAQQPYQNAGWAEDALGFMRYEWMLEAGGMPVSFAGLITVRQGALYTLTASGAAVDMEALHEANLRVLYALTFLGLIEGQPVDVETETVLSIEDDGSATPLALVDYTPVSYAEDTVLTVRTLPGAELTLRTANDTLRGKANAEGLHRFTVSTKRETVYTYTLTAQAEGRAASALEVWVDRQLAPEAQAAAYRKAARTIASLGYDALLASPDAFAGEAITFRGAVGGFVEISGFPCALVYTENPSQGVWQRPVCVLLTEPIPLEAGDIRTMYGDIRGDLLPYTDAQGKAGEAPVIILRDID